ncbi:MAG TPA: hypothetical protein VM124_02905 [Candidatus Limnocylindrales bacterium]|nr:hypothetical protein [Candidatus Limnocylindrales bacterium]
MAGKPRQESGNSGDLPPELASQLAEYRAQGQLIESGHDTIQSGLDMLRDVGRKGRLEPLRLPEHLRFAVVPVIADNLYVEVWGRSRPLAPPDWLAKESPEDVGPYVMWTRAAPRRPVFIGTLEEIDYDGPNKDHWVYNNDERTARAAVVRGVEVIVRTTVQVESLYTTE